MTKVTLYDPIKVGDTWIVEVVAHDGRGVSRHKFKRAADAYAFHEQASGDPSVHMVTKQDQKDAAYLRRKFGRKYYTRVSTETQYWALQERDLISKTKKRDA